MMNKEDSKETDEASALWQAHLKSQAAAPKRAWLSPLLFGVFGAVALGILILGLWFVAFN
jgi:hypothetical protein